MFKLSNLSIALAAAALSTGAAFADTAADDRSYLPPQKLQAQEADVKAAPQTGHRLRSPRYNTAHRHARGRGLSGILVSLFR